MYDVSTDAAGAPALGVTVGPPTHFGRPLLEGLVFMSSSTNPGHKRRHSSVTYIMLLLAVGVLSLEAWYLAMQRPIHGPTQWRYFIPAGTLLALHLIAIPAYAVWIGRHPTTLRICIFAILLVLSLLSFCLFAFATTNVF